MKFIKTGKFLCRAGDKNLFSVHTGVSYVKEVSWLRMSNVGIINTTNTLDQTAEWFPQEELLAGDEIKIKIVESDSPTKYKVKNNFGTEVTIHKDARFFCDFCGAEASQEIKMMVGPIGSNICNDCLRKYNPDKVEKA